MRKKILSILITFILMIIYINPVSAAETLHAKYAVVIDGDTCRKLYVKDEDIMVPNASTTKTATFITALEVCTENIICTVSSYAASMPDVQLNAVKGDSFYINDLYYSMMLKSHNDVAEIVAENVAFYYICNTPVSEIPFIEYLNKDYDYSENDFEQVTNLKKNDQFDSSPLSNISTETSQFLCACFVSLMNYRFTNDGCDNINFVTPNGLDKDNLTGPHSISAYSLAKIMSHCIKNETFLSVTQTKSYSFSNISGTRSYSVNNANAFLDMYENIISGKTGFTGNAGYCYVCAYKDESRTFIVVLFACGWPSNKTYKWSDARQLLNHCRDSYKYEQIIDNSFYIKPIHVSNGLLDTVSLYINENLNLLVSNDDKIDVKINVPSSINAPCTKDDIAGSVDVYINDVLFKSIPVLLGDNIVKKDFSYYIIKTLTNYFLSTNSL